MSGGEGLDALATNLIISKLPLVFPPIIPRKYTLTMHHGFLQFSSIVTASKDFDTLADIETVIQEESFKQSAVLECH